MAPFIELGVDYETWPVSRKVMPQKMHQLVGYLATKAVDKYLAPLLDGRVGHAPVLARRYSGHTPRKTRVPTIA